MTPTFARERAYLSAARSVGLRWRGYLCFSLIPVVVIVAALATPPLPLKQFVAGAAAGGVTMLLLVSVASFNNRQMLGHMAETFSIESLRKVPGWKIIENLPFDGFDVDHVVITPSGLLAVETKFFGVVNEGSEWASRRATDARHASLKSARTVRSLLRSYKLHDRLTVTPVLMIWGPGSPKFAEGHRLVDGVYVVQAEYPKLWAHLFQSSTVSAEDRDEVHQAIKTYLSNKHAADKQAREPLRESMWREFLQGVKKERAERAARSKQAAEIRAQRGSVAAPPTG